MGDFKTPLSLGQLSPGTAIQIIEDVVATVLDITAAAWPHLCEKKQVGPTDKEDDITDRLRWEMVEEKNRRDPPPQLRFDRETQRDDPNNEYPTGLIDIYVVYSFDESKYFAMECKKVTDRHKEPVDHYIDEGVCRFSSGKYCPGLPYGAMVAYVTDGAAEAAASFVGGKLIALDRKATRICMAWGWRTETRFGGIPNLFSTQHGQKGNRNTITLLHLFLPFAVQN